MKVIISFLAAALILIASCKPSPENQQEQNTEKAQVNPEHVVLIDMDVNGMTCTGCENTIKTGVSELAGIVSVEASHTDAKTWIKADTTLVDINKIKEVISGKGYEVAGSRIGTLEDSASHKEAGTE